MTTVHKVLYGQELTDIFLLILALLRIKITDPEEKVRETACRILGQLDYEMTLHHVSRQTLEVLAQRIQDKKVRWSAVTMKSGAEGSVNAAFTDLYASILSRSNRLVLFISGP